jgi:lipopolysaccharide exporter
VNFHIPSFVAELKDSSFLKNILVVMSGTALAQVIGFALSPIISRLFSPTDFGVFGSFGAVSGIITAGATLEYSQAIMLPKAKEDAINLLTFAFLCTFAISFLCLTFCLVLPATVNNLMKTKGVWALALLVLTTLVAGANQLWQAWAVRVKAFKHTSASQVIRSISSNGTRITFGYLKGGAPGLIVSSILGDVLASINLVRVFLPDFSALRSCIRWARMKQLAKDYHDFPLYSASQNVINALSAGLPVLLLTHFYGIPVAGAYAFGVSVLQVPMGFILTALRQVLFQKACETQHGGKSIAVLYVRTTAALFAMVLLPSLILIIWAPQIFSWIFGSKWLLAGEMARSLVIWLAIVFCNLPAVLFARIIRMQRFVFFYDLALLAARSFALLFGGQHFRVLGTVMLFAIVGAVMNAVLIFFVGRAVMKKEGSTTFGQLRDFLTKA